MIATNQKALERAIAERDALIGVLNSERQASAELNREIGRLAQLVRQLGGEPEID